MLVRPALGQRLFSDEEPLSAPHLMPVEAANILRRAAVAGDITADAASLAHADLLDLRVELFPFAPFAARAWELRDTVTSFDAWYISLAELLGSKLATLDVRLARATETRCGFETPPHCLSGRSAWAGCCLSADRISDTEEVTGPGAEYLNAN